MVLSFLAFVFVIVNAQATPNPPPDMAEKPARVAEQSAPALPQRPDTNAEMAMWLVNLARHQGHIVGRADPRSASLHVLALLEAAADVHPQCAEAFYWLYDLQQRMNQTKQATASLARFCQLAPQDDAARIRLFEIGLDDQQNAENRVRFVQSALQQTPLAPAYESELRFWLARFHYERNDTAQAGKELENALRLNPMNIQARELAYEMYGETEAELQRVEMALQLISINPTQANLVWELGEFLDRLSLHKQAQEWLNRAIAMHKSTENAKVPAEYWHLLAMSYLSSGDFGKAKEAEDAALQADPDYQVAKILRSTALAKLGKADEAAADLDAVGKAYAARVDEVVSKKLADEAAEIAWFYCYHKPDKDKALKLAETAQTAAKPSHQARLAYGYALRASGKADEALKVLEPLASVDQMAAMEVAKIYADRSRKADAITLLTKAAALRHSGIAFNLIGEALAKYNEKAPAVPPQPKILAALDRFHRDVFDFPKRPGDFLKFTVRFEERSLPQLGPIQVVCRLENSAPFPITFGEGYMVRPLVAISAQVGGLEPAAFKNYLQVLMNSRSVLLPGDAMEKTVAMDVGPIRELLIRNSAATLPIELTAMLDPVFKDDELCKGLGTVVAAAVTAERKGLDISPGAVGDLLKEVAAQDVGPRILAADRIGAILAYAEKNKLKTAAAKTPVHDLRAGLAKLLADADWRVRAHAVTAASWSALDDAVTAAAAPTVRDQNAVVKALAIRLFAPQHGEKFKPVLEQLGKTDPSHFVRMMALSYLPETTAAQASTANTAEAGQ